MARIVCKISCVAIFNLLYTSMFSDGITLIPYEDNPIVGRPFKLECNTETTIVATVNIKSPDDTPIGSCVPAAPPFPATCANAAGYEANLNESLHTLRINTSSMASDVNGTWVCLHDGERATYALASPLTEIKDERLHLTPFTNNITTTPVSLTATYECINIPVYFKWFVEDNSSQKNPLDVVNTAEVNSSLCTTYPGFNAYTQTYSTSYVKGLDGSYSIGVEVHYSGEVTALQSIQYFNTYFIFSPPTTTSPSTDETTPEKTNGSSKYSSEGNNTKTDNDNSDGKAIGIGIGILTGIMVITCIIVIVMVAKRLYIRSTGETSGNCFLTFCQFIEEKLFYCRGNINSKTYWLLGFVYLVLYGVIVELIVLLAVYYGFAGFQEGLVISVGIVIVLVLSGICLLVVWMLKKVFNNDASEEYRSQTYTTISFCIIKPDESWIRLSNRTVTPDERGKSQKKSTFDKRQQPDGHEGPQSTPKDPDARHLTTGRPLPRRPDIVSPQTAPFNSVNSPRPIVLAPIENPNIIPSIDTLDEQKTDKKPKDKKKKKKKKKKMKDEEQDNPAYVQDNNVLT